MTDALLSTVTDTDGSTLALVTTEPMLPGTLYSNGYRLPSTLDFDRWLEITRYLQDQATAIQWRLGDALVFGLEKWGDEAYQAVADQAQTALGRSDEWIDQIVAVARAFPLTMRVPGLRWSHHRAVMLRELPASERLTLLEEAAAEGLTTRELGERARGRSNVIHGDVIDIPPSAEPDDDEMPYSEVVAELLALIADFSGFTASLLSHRRKDGMLHLEHCRFGESVDGYHAPDGAPCSTTCGHAKALLQKAAILDGHV